MDNKILLYSTGKYIQNPVTSHNEKEYEKEIYIYKWSHFSHVRLYATPKTAAHQAPPSLGFSRQEHWSGLPFPSPMLESEKWKWSRFSRVRLFATPWTAAHQAPPSMGFSRQEYGVGCHCLLRYIFSHTLDSIFYPSVFIHDQSRSTCSSFHLNSVDTYASQNFSRKKKGKLNQPTK